MLFAGHVQVLMSQEKKNFKTSTGVEGIYKKVVVSGDVVETYDYE